MKQIETIATGKNFSAVSVGKMNEIIEHELPMLPIPPNWHSWQKARMPLSLLTIPVGRIPVSTKRRWRTILKS